ncbi:MAG: hypothetical protein ACKVVP_07470, partial [Chloroflexota bacterium]
FEKFSDLSTTPSRRRLPSAMRETVHPRDRVAHLKSLCSAEHWSIWEGVRIDAIVDALTAWQGQAAVDVWSQTGIPALIVQRFGDFMRWAEIHGDWVPRLMDAARLSPAVRLQVLFDSLETSGLVLGARAVFAVAEMFAASMAASDVADVLQWYLDRLGTRVPAETKYPIDIDQLPESIEGVIGRFLFALMSDIDVRERWRAAHSLRRLARLGMIEIIESTVVNWERESERVFRDPESPFYSLAARLWLAMSLSRISVEVPMAVAPHADLLARVALDTRLPHVAIREHAKRTLLSLVKNGNLSAQTLDITAINSINTSKLDRVQLDRIGDRSFRGTSTSDRAFQFDVMDTLPYWYSSILRMFPDVTEEEVLSIAERWIVTTWGAQKDANHWATEPRKGRYDERRYSAWMHRQGSLPIIERYGTYLEWHAMLCTVGEFLETHGLSGREESYDRFQSWLARLMPTIDDCWISDLRCPLPLERRFWSANHLSDEDWHGDAPNQDYLEELGIAAGIRPGWIVVAASHRSHFDSRGSSVHVDTALVTPDTAPALTRALQSARDPHDFRIPPDGDHLQIDAPPYRLIGWLEDRYSDSGFDEDDPIRFQARVPGSTPGAAVTAFLALSKLRGALPVWEATADNSSNIEAEIWSDPFEMGTDRVERPRWSDGWRLWMRADKLKAFLESQGMDLVSSVQITRTTRDETARRYAADTKSVTLNLVVVLRRDGELHGATGCIGTWPTTG